MIDAGNCNGLWEALSSGDSKPIGVITGKSASGLPTKDMVQKLQSYTSELSCTHRQSLSESILKSIVRRTLNASDRAIKDFLAIDAVDTRKTDLETGFGDLVEVGIPIYGKCSYYFDRKGNLVDSQVDEPCVREIKSPLEPCAVPAVNSGNMLVDCPVSADDRVSGP